MSDDRFWDVHGNDPTDEYLAQVEAAEKMSTLEENMRKRKLMTRENKLRVKEEIAKDNNWVVIDGILGESISVLDWNKEVQIMYQDMDNRPQICNAKCVKIDFSDAYFVATNGQAVGNRMRDVIAYRPLAEVIVND